MVAKPNPRRQVVALDKPGQKLELPYEDSAERVIHSYSVNFAFGKEDSASHSYGTFHAHPGETVSVTVAKGDDGSNVTTITRTPDAEE